MNNDNMFLGVFNRNNQDYESVLNNMYSNIRDGEGLLPEEAIAYFLKKAILDKTILNELTPVPMKSMKQNRPHVGINGRIMHAGYSNAQDHEVNPDIPLTQYQFDGNELDAKLTRACVELPDDVVDDNIEKERFIQTALDLASEHWGADLEYLGVFGDKANTTTNDLIPLLDGWYKKATNEVVTSELPEHFDVETIFDTMLRKLPAPFKTNMSNLRFYVPYDVMDSYRNCLRERGTALGDTAQTKYENLTYKGIPVVYNATLDAPDSPLPDGKKPILFTNKGNFVYGIYKELKVEPERIASKMSTKYWFNARIDVTADFSDGIVKCAITPDEMKQLG